MNPTAPKSWLETAKFGGVAQDALAPSRSSAAQDPARTKEMFLQLLVAQMRNQNPLNPADGAEFLAQLSQITGVEQMLEIRKQLEGIRSLLERTGGEAAAAKP